MRASRIAFAALALAGGVTAGYGGDMGVGLKAPPLEVAKWVQGKPIKLGDGKTISVIEFWATW